FRTILDANVVTCITALVLFAVATAGVKGFALMLLIGTVISLVDRKSTRLNSSHSQISYAVFCLKKKKKKTKHTSPLKQKTNTKSSSSPSACKCRPTRS